jgi:hypothetical protein
MLHGEQHAGLGGDSVVGRRDGLIAIRNIRGHVDVELKFACCTWFPLASSSPAPAATVIPLIPEEGVTPSVGAWSTWLQKICAADTTLLSAG